MMARENLTAHHSSERCMAVSRVECEGITTGVTSWIVHTTGILDGGKMLRVGEKSRFARTRAAARLTAPNLHRYSRASRAECERSNPRPSSIMLASFAAAGQANTQKLTSGSTL